MARLFLLFLGPFQVELDQQPAVGFESNKVRALLAYLAVEAHRPHSRQALAGLLWPDYPDRSALNNLRSALANLRQAVGDQQAEPRFLLISRDTIQFNPASNYWLDVDSLLDIPHLPVGQLEQIINAYRGTFLEGFTLADSPDFEEWLLYKREQTAQQALNALQRLSAYHEERRDFDSAKNFTRRRLELEPWDEDAHCQLMRALALAGQRSSALAQYETCRRLLKKELGVEPGRETTALYESIRDGTFLPAPIRCAAEQNSSLPEPPAAGKSPYKGMQFFDEEDTYLFFGRSELTARLLQQVAECLSEGEEQVRFLTVIGASGSGKSSVLRAGLVPELKNNQNLQVNAANMSIPYRGLVHVITPTARPLEALAISFMNGSEPLNTVTQMIDNLSQDPRSLHIAAIQATRRKAASHLVLVVDQFEELFSLCHLESERKAFVDNLLHAVSIPGPTMVVISLRADFYAHCAPYTRLRLAVCQRQEYIGAMTFDELRKAIEEPARGGGWGLEPGLVDLLLRDVGNEPGALPLLSHALLETWQRRRGRCLTLAGYAESGGVHGAIARTAEVTFSQLTAEQQVAARNIFLRLTELGEGTQDTRRRAALSEMVSDNHDAPLVTGVLKHLADARLITVSQETAEVAHEALIREWSTLHEWLNDNRQGLRLHRQLTMAAQEWEKLNKDSELLYRGIRLAQALEWAETNVEILNQLEQAFLHASQAEQQAQREAETERQQRELAAAQALFEAQRQRAEAEQRRAEEQTRAATRLRSRAVYLALALGAALVLLFAVVWLGQLANRTARDAEAQARLASSRELAAAAVSNLQVDPERSVLLALQALSTADTLEARNSLHRALPELHILHTIPAHRQTPGIDYSPDGRRLASVGTESPVKIWDAATGQELLSLPVEPGGYGMEVDFSPDGKLLAAAWTHQVIVWDLDRGEVIFKLAADLSGPTILHIRFSPDGTRLAVSNIEGVPKVLDVATQTEYLAFRGHTQMCDAIDYSPDGSRIVTGDQAGRVKIWDATTGQELLSFESSGVIHDLAYSPDGRRLATANEDGSLKIWNPDTGEELLEVARMSGLYGVTFMPDSQRVISAHQDGSTKVWDANTGQLLQTLAGHVSTVVDVASSPDGTAIATGGYDGFVRIWDTSAGRELITVSAHSDQAWDVSYSPDGQRMATVALDQTIKIWNPKTGDLLNTIPSDTGLTSLAYSQDGKYLATGSWDGTSNIWDARTGENLMTLAGHQGIVAGITISTDGRRAATASWDGLVKVWDLDTGQEVVTFSQHGNGILLFGVAFSPDGKWVFSGGGDGYARQWDAANGQEVRAYSGEGREGYGLALSPDGRLLALGLQDGAILLFDTEHGTKQHELSGHAGLTMRVAFSPDGSQLASGSFDGFAKVWDVQNGQELFTLYGNSSNVFGVAFSPDGSQLATAGGDGTLRTYSLQMNELVRLSHTRLTRSLNDAECRQFLHLEQCQEE